MKIFGVVLGIVLTFSIFTASEALADQNDPELLPFAETLCGPGTTKIFAHYYHFVFEDTEVITPFPHVFCIFPLNGFVRKSIAAGVDKEIVLERYYIFGSLLIGFDFFPQTGEQMKIDGAGDLNITNVHVREKAILERQEDPRSIIGLFIGVFDTRTKGMLGSTRLYCDPKNHSLCKIESKI